jgi:hypothetical protein
VASLALLLNTLGASLSDLIKPAATNIFCTAHQRSTWQQLNARHATCCGTELARISHDFQYSAAQPFGRVTGCTVSLVRRTVGMRGGQGRHLPRSRRDRLHRRRWPIRPQ